MHQKATLFLVAFLLAVSFCQAMFLPLRPPVNSFAMFLFGDSNELCKHFYGPNAYDRCRYPFAD